MQQGLAQGRHPSLQCLLRRDLMDQTQAQGLCRIEAFSGEEVTVRGTRAHGTNDIRADGGWDQAEFDFTQAITRTLCADGDVARRHQSQAPGIHIALDLGDGGFGAFKDGAQHARQLARIVDVLLAGVIGHAPHPVQVSAGAKGLALSRQHHTAHRRVAAGLLKSHSDLGDQGFVERIAHLWTRQGDGAHPLSRLDFQMIHGFTS